ncbi:putative membrane protein [Mycena chlorophos]|uniref:Efficient mitochondria targeting-associated protein 19 n=1 Tax=Mycena chlorophos TaxID=658473 RepID=A0A8H6VZZ2_MYCCL|nr:putative membrane protein [Mycena chlorophos]
MSPRPLTARPLDLVYFVFFVTHIPASLCIDFQPLYPPALVPGFIKDFAAFYLKTSNDPLIKAAFGLAEPLVWFQSFLFLELAFQFPVFFIAARGLWNDSRKIYVLILVYAASTATTVWACLATVVATPLASNELAMLLASYVPFFLIPLVMTIDMAFRVQGIVSDALAAPAQNSEKQK